MDCGNDWTNILSRSPYSGVSNFTRWENSSPLAANFLASVIVCIWSAL